MKVKTEELLNILRENYNIDLDANDVSQINGEDNKDDQIIVGENIYNVNDDTDTETLASFIYNNINDSQPVEMQESLDSIEVGNIYVFLPSYDNVNTDDTVFEKNLKKLAEYRPFCQVRDKLITSKEEDEGFFEVTFDIPENDKFDIPDELIKDTYIVFESDLIPQYGEKKEEVAENYNQDSMLEELKNTRVSTIAEAPFVVNDVVVDQHSGEIELECYDREEKENFDKYLGYAGSFSAIKNLYLLTIKDNMYSISDELKNKALNLIQNTDATVSEDLNEVSTTSDFISTALLTALNSEKEAVSIYEMLIKQAEDAEEVELLSKILGDEKEHVALLSGLQAKKTADSVAPDNKEQLNDYAEAVIDTPPAE